MKFLVDAHLPPRLCAVLQLAGHEAMHTGQLKAQNQTPDGIINEVSMTERDLTDLFERHLPAVVVAFADSSLVELDRRAAQNRALRHETQ